MELVAALWRGGIKAEFGYKPNPKMGDQLTYALEQVRRPRGVTAQTQHVPHQRVC